MRNQRLKISNQRCHNFLLRALIKKNSIMEISDFWGYFWIYNYFFQSGLPKPPSSALGFSKGKIHFFDKCSKIGLFAKKMIITF